MTAFSVLALMASTLIELAPAQATARKSPIKIMVTGPFVSTVYSVPEVPPAAAAAASTINAAGGIYGHKVQIITCDDQLNPNLATSCAQTAVTDHVTAATGLLIFSAQTFGVLTPSNIPFIDFNPVGPIEVKAANSFPISAGTDPELTGLARRIVETGAKRISIIHGNSASNLLGYPSFVQGVNLAGGTVVATVTAVLHSPSYAVYVQQALAPGNVQGLLYVGLPSDFNNLVLAARQAGFTGPMGFLLSGLPDAALAPTLQALGANANNLYFASPFYFPPSPQAKGFLASMAKYAPTDVITPLSEGVWMAINTVAAAFKSSKSTKFTAAALSASLNSQKHLNIGPEAPIFNMTIKGTIVTEAPRSFSLKVLVYHWLNGTLIQDGPLFNPYKF